MRLITSVTGGIFFVMTGLAWSIDCYKSAILSPGTFTGANGEIVKLVDGSLWEVKDGMKLCEYNPDVMICPSQGKLLVKGHMLKVEQVVVKESYPAWQSQKASSTK